ncbi:MAG: acyl-CoA dehydrogenase family protein [Conexivisphaerales archaeon]
MEGLFHFKNPLIELSQEEQIFRDSIAEFCSKELAPKWERYDEEASVSPKVQLDLLTKLGRQGVLAMMCREENGGQAASETLATIAVEEIAYADPSVATAVYTLLNIGWPFVLERHGNEALAQRVISKVARGEAFFGIASTEAQGGSDIANLKTKAEKEKDGRGYRISGEKSFISGVNEVFSLPWGGGWLLLARTGGEGHAGLTAFAALPKEDGRGKGGCTYSLFHGMGRHNLSTGLISFQDFRIEKENLIGEEGRGFYVAMEGFNCARILVAAACVGAARWLLERGAEWVKQREAFGRKISNFQGISFRLSELYGKYEAARMMVYRAARLFDKVYADKAAGYRLSDLNGPVAMAKMWGPEVSVEIAQEVMRWFGAVSFTREHPVHRSLLGLLSYVIGAEGSQNIMKYIASRELLGGEYVK